MNSQLSRRDLFSRLVRPFQPMAEVPAARKAGRSTGSMDAQQKDGAQDLVAIVQGRHCLALTSFCAVCLERCPVPGAMQSVGGMPMVMPEACTGCGICQQVCPAPEKAVLLMPRRGRARRVGGRGSETLPELAGGDACATSHACATAVLTRGKLHYEHARS